MTISSPSISIARRPEADLTIKFSQSVAGSTVPSSTDSICCSRRNTFYPKSDIAIGDEVLRSLRAMTDEELGISTALVARAAARALSEPDLEVCRLVEQGTFHRLFRVTTTGGTSMVCRANAISAWQRDGLMQVEEYVARHVRNHGLPAVQVLFTDTSRTEVPFEYQLVEEVKGWTLRDFDDDDARLRPLLVHLGELFATLHEIEFPGFGFPKLQPLTERNQTQDIVGTHATWGDYLSVRLDEHLGLCVDIGAITAKEANEVSTVFADVGGKLDLGTGGALLHGDPGNHNLFTDGRSITKLIDWEDCLIGDPVFELAFWATFHPPRRHAALLEGYCRRASLTDDFEFRFWLYFLRVSLAKTVHRFRFGYRDHPGRPPAAARIRLGLEHTRAAA